jgi:hypothetical protein
MTEERRPDVVLTDHVIDRLEERASSVDVRREVREALEAGRIACTKPRPLVELGRRRARAHPRTLRFVWTEGFERAYVVRMRREGERRRRVVLVVTVLTSIDASGGELEAVA